MRSRTARCASRCLPELAVSLLERRGAPHPVPGRGAPRYRRGAGAALPRDVRAGHDGPAALARDGGAGDVDRGRCGDDDGRRRDEGARGGRRRRRESRYRARAALAGTELRSWRRWRRCCATTFRMRSATSCLARAGRLATLIANRLRLSPHAVAQLGGGHVGQSPSPEVVTDPRVQDIRDGSWLRRSTVLWSWPIRSVGSFLIEGSFRCAHLRPARSMAPTSIVTDRDIHTTTSSVQREAAHSTICSAVIGSDVMRTP